MRVSVWALVCLTLAFLIVASFSILSHGTSGGQERQGMWGVMPLHQEEEASEEHHFINYIYTADISPDGSLAAIVVGKETGKSRTLFAYSFEEGKAWKIADGVTNCAWVDKETLLFHKTQGDNPPSVWEWRRDYPEPKLMFKKAFNPFPSPDGRWVVCLPSDDIKDEASLKKVCNLIIYDRLQGKERMVSLGECPPLFCSWSPDSKNLYAFGISPSTSLPTTFAILLLNPPSFKPKVVSTDSYPLAQKGSWCLEDGSVVFVKRKDSEQYTSPQFKVPIPSEGKDGMPPLSTFCFWKYSEQEGEAKLIWEERGYSRSFAISPDGCFLLIPHEGLDPKNRVYFYLNLIDLQSKETKSIEKEEIKQGVGRVWYHQELKGFCIVTPTKLLLLQGQGKVKELISIKDIDGM